ncbi:MAG: flagellar assembly protein FliH [Clostridium sp.]|nr:flagellar assembly protein FliH [Clostridium sp.]
MLLSSNVIKNTKIKSNERKEIVTEGYTKVNNQSLEDIKGILEENSSGNYKAITEFASSIVEDAKKKAEEIKQKAILDAQEIEVKAHEEGYKAGEKEGYDKAYNETIVKGKLEVENFKSLAEQNASSIITNAKYNYEKYLLDNRESIKKLSLSIAENILKREVKNEDGINDMIYSAVELSKNSELIMIKCNKTHVNSVKDAVQNWKREMPTLKQIFVIEDNFLKDGSSIIEKNNGKIKVDIDIGLDKIKSEILNSH